MGDAQCATDCSDDQSRTMLPGLATRPFQHQRDLVVWSLEFGSGVGVTFPPVMSHRLFFKIRHVSAVPPISDHAFVNHFARGSARSHELLHDRKRLAGLHGATRLNRRCDDAWLLRKRVQAIPLLFPE